MTAYTIKLALLVPLVAALAWGSLWAWRRLQPGIATGTKVRRVAVIDAVPLGTGGRLAVVAFAGRELLVAVSRSGVQLIADDMRVRDDA